MKMLLTLALMLTLGSSAARAVVTVSVSSGLGDPVFLNSGSVAVDGAQVRVGTFDDGFDVPANAANPADFLGGWTPFGEVTTMTIGGEAGHVGGAVSAANPFFDEKQIYLWVSLVGGDEHALLTSDQANWTFPTEGGAVSFTLVSTSEVNIVHHGEFSGGNLQFQQSIPEPSTSLLVLLAMGFCGWHRRRSSSSPAFH